MVPCKQVEMKMLFEVMDLAVASPATVSRIGVIYMTPSNLGWMPYVQSWVRMTVTGKVRFFMKCREGEGGGGGGGKQTLVHSRHLLYAERGVIMIHTVDEPSCTIM